MPDSQTGSGRFNVRAHGAVGDGTHFDGPAVQAAIDACGAGNGGTVLVPPGRYRAGTVTLRDRVTLRLEAGATILGSRDIGDYSEAVPAFLDGTGVRRGDALVYATRATNVGIEGGGVIDGQGDGFRERRPMLIRFLECKGVIVQGITLRNSAAWVHHYLRCDDVRIHGVTVQSRCNKNNDGLNLDGCHRVRVSDCHFSSGDDALTFKSTSDRPCRDIAVSNCLLSSDCNGLKFGTESIGGFENVCVSNCVIYDTRLCGITVATVDGGPLCDVTISNITMRNVGAAFFIRRGARGYHVGDGGEPCRPGPLRHVVLRGIRARNVDATGSSILGLPGAPVEDVVVDDVSITCRGGGARADAEREPPEQPGRYPQYEQWGVLPAYGLYGRHVRGLRVRDLRCELSGNDDRSPVVFDDVDDLRVDGLSSALGGHAGGGLRLRAVRGAIVDGRRVQA